MECSLVGKLNHGILKICNWKNNSIHPHHVNHHSIHPQPFSLSKKKFKPKRKLKINLTIEVSDKIFKTAVDFLHFSYFKYFAMKKFEISSDGGVCSLIYSGID